MGCLDHRTEFVKEVESIGKTPDAHIYELDEPLIRAKGANMTCPRLSLTDLT